MANHHKVQIMPFYLARADGKGSAHLWTGDDTFCSMFSTNKDWQRNKWALYEIEELGPRPVCKVCMNLAAKHPKRDW